MLLSARAPAPPAAATAVLLAAVLMVAWAPPAPAQPVGPAPGTAAGERPDPRPARRLVVGVKEAPPFALRDPATGRWEGLSVALWREVAADLGLAYELRETDLAGLLEGLEEGRFDVGVAALTVTADRELRMDFSHPFYSSGLGIAVATAGGDGAWALARRVLSPDLLQVIWLLALVLAVAGFLVWLFERRRNPDFGGGTMAGLGSAFWWSAVTMTTVGYGDKAPRTAGGRLVALFWMFASVVMISTFTAAIASSLTVARLDLPVAGPEDLPRVTLATVTRLTSAQYLERRGIRRQEMPTLDRALAAVADGEALALVYDRPILRYRVKRDHPGRLDVLPQTFERQDYAFGLRQGSPLREPINRALLRALAGENQRRRLADYLGDDA
ncbi:MAG TPA: transporter substrate-binding domain-containing protein [Thermoanaerobaculia bacterium]|nr:transporter substrate-binding domain-containing protein [Thermoanaerobaculia bacterium]